LDRIARFLLVLDGDGTAKPFNGSFLEWRASLEAKAETPKEVPAGSGQGLGQGRQSAARKKKLSFADRRELDSLLPEIDALEEEKLRLETLFSSSGADPVEIRTGHIRYEELGLLIEAKTLRWEELAQREADG
jgi:ATP-binding cassette subfamily F protein uup